MFSFSSAAVPPNFHFRRTSTDIKETRRFNGQCIVKKYIFEGRGML